MSSFIPQYFLFMILKVLLLLYICFVSIENIFKCLCFKYIYFSIYTLYILNFSGEKFAQIESFAKLKQWIKSFERFSCLKNIYFWKVSSPMYYSKQPIFLVLGALQQPLHSMYMLSMMI